MSHPGGNGRRGHHCKDLGQSALENLRTSVDMLPLDFNLRQ